MKVNEVTQFDEMAVSTGGLNYENSVLKAVRQTLKKYKGYVRVLDDELGTAGFSNVGVDLELEIAGKLFAVEIKQNANAQMGGTSIYYDLESDQAYLVKPEATEEEIQQLFIDVTKSKKEDFIKFIKRLKKYSPAPYKQRIKNSIPLGSVLVDAWDKAKKDGLLKSLNDKIRFDNTDLIAKHYNKKGVYYIQIGGAGLFYLIKNPLNLPVPKFEGEIEIELRMGRGGSGGKPVASSGYRVQGRLKTAIESPLSLDNPADVATIFQTIIDSGGKPAAKATAKATAKAADKKAAKTTDKAADKKVDTKPVAKPAVDTKTVKPIGTNPKVDPKQKAKAALASGGKSKKG